jgi:N6-L-threonylcarbamoyladenine synthase
MLVLGIETSCDETSAGVARGPREGAVELLSNVVASQDDLHAHFGGIVPEVASRRHVEMIIPVVAESLQRAEVSWSDLDAIAVAVGPGLIGSLVVGVAAAQAFAVARNLPLVGIHHLEGHIYSATIGGALPLPAIILIASGGHSHLVVMRDHGHYEILGRTRDDAPGEAFDKGARLLGLPYPGGPQLAALADSYQGRVEPLPRAQLPGSLDFSFSGVKTALARLVREGALDDARRLELAAGYQESIVMSLAERTLAAAEDLGFLPVVVVGGVARNRRLRELMQELAEERGLRVTFPAPELCTDNGAMIAAAGSYKPPSTPIDPPSANLPLTSWAAPE